MIAGENMTNRPDFEIIFGMYDVKPGFYGVKRHFGKIVEVVRPGYVFGIPFIDEIALVPEIPGILSGLEQKVRSSDDRSVDIVSDTTLAITKPATFMRKSPDDYLEKLAPSIQQAVQETIGSGYTARDVVEKNEAVSTAIKDQLITALNSLGWGIGVKLFRYISTTDPADLINGDAQKLRVAELADAEGRRRVAVVEADAASQVDFIARKYQIEAEVLALRQEGQALAEVQKATGLAETDVLERRLGVYHSYAERVVTTISSARASLQPQDAELLVLQLLAPLQSMAGAQGTAALDSVRQAVISKTTQRLQGQAVSGYITAVSQSGVNPNAAMVARVVPEVLSAIKKS